MDWQYKHWSLEDDLYQEKRKVDNKASHIIHHIMGGFHSHKLNRVVEYQSLTEYIFFALLELDEYTVRYYVRPVEVFTEQARSPYVPDVLVFRQGSIPLLFDIEAGPVDLEKNRYRESARYAKKNDWGYRVIYPKKIPKVIERNLSLLEGFTGARSGLSQFKDEILYRVSAVGEISIEGLAESFRQKANPLLVLPHIYHLIANNKLSVELQRPINEHSLVTRKTSYYAELFEWGAGYDAFQ